MIKWLHWDIFNPICPKGHDNCDMVQLSNKYVFCYTCKEKYFEEDYNRTEGGLND